RLLDRYHRPYHEVLSRTANRGGVRLALDCHSMFAYGPPDTPDAGKARPMFRLGNLGDENAEGTGITAKPALVKLIADLLEKEFADIEPMEGNVRVAINTPQVSSYTLKRHGKGRTPWVQFDINRAIYLKDPEDRSNVPDSDRERISQLRRRIYSVMCSLAEVIDNYV
ncbi:unnamed protein product, partial [Phaeothamnion confervicola]